MRIINQAVKDFVVKERRACFYFDLAEIEKNFSSLAGLADKQIHFIFPVKSFNREEILLLARKHLSGFDVSNSQEMEAIRNLYGKDNILWSSSPVPWTADGLNIFMDGSHTRVTWPEGLKRSLRVRLDSSSRFGTDLATIVPGDLIKQQVTALHFHHGDETTTAMALPLAIKQIAKLVKEVDQITHINLGGSFGSLAIQDIEDIVNLARTELPHQQIIFEPGRWISRNAGLLLGRVEDINIASGKGYVTTSLSRDCHLRWHNQQFRFSFHSMSLAPTKSCTDILIGGATCHEADTIGQIQDDDLELAIGDLVAVSDVTGYSVAWNHAFNGIPAAEVIFLN